MGVDLAGPGGLPKAVEGEKGTPEIPDSDGTSPLKDIPEMLKQAREKRAHNAPEPSQPGGKPRLKAMETFADDEPKDMKTAGDKDTPRRGVRK
jgi:hypothetical protein